MLRLDFPYTCSLGLILLVTGCGQQPLSAPVVSQEVASQEAAPQAAAPSETSTTEPATTPSHVEATKIASSDAEPVSLTPSETQTTAPVKSALARNPFQPPTVTVRKLTPNQVQTSDIRLLGIAKRDNQRFVIIENSGELSKAAVGDSVRDWEVVRIGDTQVTLRRGLEEILLTIK